MRVSEEQRRTLFELLRDHLDEETARLVLEVTVPANVELATRGDFQELRGEMLLRLAQVDGRITEVEANLSRQISALHDRVTEMDGRISGLDARIDKLDARISGLEARIDKLDARISGLEARISGLEARISGLDARLDKLDARISGLDARIGGLDARIGGLDARLGGLDGRIDGIEAKLTGKLYKVVVPVLIASNLLIVAVATWIGTVVG